MKFRHKLCIGLTQNRICYSLHTQRRFHGIIKDTTQRLWDGLLQIVFIFYGLNLTYLEHSLHDKLKWQSSYKKDHLRESEDFSNSVVLRTKCSSSMCLTLYKLANLETKTPTKGQVPKEVILYRKTKILAHKPNSDVIHTGTIEKLCAFP